MKRLIFLFLTVVLITAIAIPTLTLAKDNSLPKAPKSLNLTMTPTSIDQPSISTLPWPQADPAGANSWPILDLVNGVPTTVGWLVDHRSIYGTVSGDAAGSFTLTYGGVLDTLQSGSIHGIVTITTAKGTIYLSARGTSETTIRETYEIFGEGGIEEWCGLLGITVGEFFAEFYGVPELEYLPVEQLASEYGTTLPLLPKTLEDSFKGTVIVESGTGYYAAIHGTARFNPAARQPVILDVYPSQHVYNISGAIVLRGFSSMERARLPQVELGNVKDNIRKWLKNNR